MSTPRSKHGAEFRILLVEDNRYDADLTKAVVEVYLTCKVIVVATKAAFEAELNEEVPDLILSDSSLRGFDGLGALALASQKHPNVPFVFCTGNTSEENKAIAMSQGAADYISKDNILGLISVLRRFCRDT